jgi:hypothetical protein
MSESTLSPSPQLIKFLQVTGSLFLNMSSATTEFNKLTEQDFSYVFSILSEPATWGEMTDKDKIFYTGRFDNGRILRNQIK